MMKVRPRLRRRVRDRDGENMENIRQKSRRKMKMSVLKIMRMKSVLEENGFHCIK